MDDREIKSWEQRLADQVQRDWDNYKHLHIDLSTARIDVPYVIPGEYLYVEEHSSASAVAKIKLSRNTNDALDLEKGVKIETVFKQVFITNDALQDEWLDLVFDINFKYKKKIINEAAGPFMFTTGGPLITPAGVDLQLLPGAGGITQIGDAGVQSHGLVNNDDLFVSGKFEVNGNLYADANAYFSSIIQAPIFVLVGSSGSSVQFRVLYEELTIPVGQGAAGIVTAGNLAPKDSTIIGVCFRVTQAPGGGATTLDIGRTGAGNLDEFIDGASCDVLGETGTFAANHDAVTTGPVLNDIDRTLTLTTDVNVAGSDMKVRIVVFYRQEIPPTS